MIDDLIGAETVYARKLGVTLKQPNIDDVATIEELREAIAAVVGAPSDGAPVVPNGWTTRYAASRIAWSMPARCGTGRTARRPPPRDGCRSLKSERRVCARQVMRP